MLPTTFQFAQTPPPPPVVRRREYVNHNAMLQLAKIPANPPLQQCRRYVNHHTRLCIGPTAPCWQKGMALIWRDWSTTTFEFAQTPQPPLLIRNKVHVNHYAQEVTMATTLSKCGWANPFQHGSEICLPLRFGNLQRARLANHVQYLPPIAVIHHCHRCHHPPPHQSTLTGQIPSNTPHDNCTTSERLLLFD